MTLMRTDVHEIHTSERRSFRACRRRWHWIFMENYYPLMTAKPLEFGVAYHEAMETFYNPETWFMDAETKMQLAMTAFVRKTEAQRQKFLTVKDASYLDADVQTDYDERVELGKGMIKYHAERVSPQYDSTWKPIRVEISFQVPILHPETGEPLTCDNPACRHAPGAPVVYAGRMDALGEDQHGDYWIVDWKTAASLSVNDEFLYLDDQIGSYVWACRVLGLPVRGFIYHEMKKGYPQPPQKNKVRRKGCMFSVSKQQTTNYDMYLETIQAEDKEAYDEGCYDDFLQWLKDEGPQYVQRFQIHKSDKEIDEIARNIGLEALDMIDSKTRVYPSPGKFGCNFCAFRTPCMGKNGGEDYQYALDTMFEKKEHYYVRDEASTDSKSAE